MSTHWYCGHCLFGPMMIATTEHCVMCFHQRDKYSTYERIEQSSIASTAPHNQLYLVSGRSERSERGIIACQHKSRPLAEMPAGFFTSAPSRWFCCGCKKFDIISVYLQGWWRIKVATGQNILKRKSSVLCAITKCAQNALSRERATNATRNCKLPFLEHLSAID